MVVDAHVAVHVAHRAAADVTGLGHRAILGRDTTEVVIEQPRDAVLDVTRGLGEDGEERRQFGVGQDRGHGLGREERADPVHTTEAGGDGTFIGATAGDGVAGMQRDIHHRAGRQDGEHGGHGEQGLLERGGHWGSLDVQLGVGIARGCVPSRRTYFQPTGLWRGCDRNPACFGAIHARQGKRPHAVAATHVVAPDRFSVVVTPPASRAPRSARARA